ncbi:hypothetical protein JB92DRAFT_287156 [Gautieria morchelliformis]|nr:hypothetical protein JB92DRAFT_287156 [Gautieria morchelliformis]
MAPLTEALRTCFVEERAGAHVYCGEVDSVWTYISVPHGGYALGLIVNACVASQARTTQMDIAHVAAHFYRTTAVGRFEVHVRTVRTGAFYTNIFADPVECVGVDVLPFLGDMMKNIPELLPEDVGPPPGWHPTMVFSLEYKAPIPADPAYARRTVGLYACGRFMHGGQHDAYVEIWTAPGAIGAGGAGAGAADDGWRERQVCLGIAHQMALTVPRAVNERKGAQGGSKL